MNDYLKVWIVYDGSTASCNVHRIVLAFDAVQAIVLAIEAGMKTKSRFTASPVMEIQGCKDAHMDASFSGAETTDYEG